MRRSARSAASATRSATSGPLRGCDELVNVLIDGQRVQVEEGWTVLEAARYYGIDIPTLCYMDGLSPYSACRLCVVEIKCGACLYVCPVCELPCMGVMEPGELCNACLDTVALDPFPSRD